MVAAEQPRTIFQGACLELDAGVVPSGLVLGDAFVQFGDTPDRQGGRVLRRLDNGCRDVDDQGGNLA